MPIQAMETEIETGRNVAKMATSSELAAFRVIDAAEGKFGIGEHIDVPTLLRALRDQSAALNEGDMTNPEAMLINQATALQSLFARLTEKALGAEYMSNFEAYMRMALRSQSQCRATLETLSAIKNPPVVYAKQANIAQGHQQVNNNVDPRAREIQNPENELLEQNDGKRLDTRTTGKTIKDDPAMATLGAVNGSKDKSRQS